MTAHKLLAEPVVMGNYRVEGFVCEVCGAVRYSCYFLPTQREVPADAQVVSHRLMLRCGMIHQTTLGIYTWMPLGVRVLQKLERLIEQEHNRIGCHRLVMPTIQPAHLWHESERYPGYGKEMLCMRDRHERDLLYGPTHEEVVTDVGRTFIKSYRDLPMILYQIGWKFRDEIRPRFGVMRSREFYMTDAYSFDLALDGALKTYEAMYNMYVALFARMGLSVAPVQAESGVMGGNFSHEFHVLAASGESKIFYDTLYEQIPLEKRVFKHMKGVYIVSDEKYDAQKCPIPAERIHSMRGIEVGHIFYFGTKYARSMRMDVMGEDGRLIQPEMGSYGIGVSRLLGAILEAHHDEYGIVWPVPVAPFMVGLIHIPQKKVDSVDDTLEDFARDTYHTLEHAGIETLWDDRDVRAGVKFHDMDLIGLPFQVIVGKQSLTSRMLEVKHRRTGERHTLSVEDCIAFLHQQTER